MLYVYVHVNDIGPGTPIDRVYHYSGRHANRAIKGEGGSLTESINRG